jgi:UDPglucose--hexose-1-phosphate uridylyltransferase
LLRAESEAGRCRVGVFSPRHDLTLASLSKSELNAVVEMWAQEFASLATVEWIRHVEIFENRGAAMGASNPHPHCQIWANATVPNVPGRESVAFREYREEKRSCLLCDYLQLELRLNERVVCENEAFAVVVPFWAVWPFETLVLSKRHVAAITELDQQERELLGEILREVVARYDRLFATIFPYSMGFHQRPTDGHKYPEWHFHAHYFPPLLRSATVQKFMVGYELLGSP